MEEWEVGELPLPISLVAARLLLLSKKQMMSYFWSPSPPSRSSPQRTKAKRTIHLLSNRLPASRCASISLTWALRPAATYACALSAALLRLLP